MDPVDALTRLKEGNKRFVSNVRGVDALFSQMNRAALVPAQRPMAIILGCADSRVPAEIVFDQGLGDLFVVRVAGNIVAPSLVGSVEFAVERFGTRLVVVLGHTHCGAVGATLDVLQAQGGTPSPNIMSIVDRIRPAVAPVVQASPGKTREELMSTAVRSNVVASVSQLRSSSQVLERHIASGHVLTVGAEYDLATGAVDFFEGVPAALRS